MTRARAPRERQRAARSSSESDSEHRVGADLREVGAAAHRDRDVGLREHRRVVDAVAHHRHARSRQLQRAHVGLLALRGGAPVDVVDAELGGDPARDAAARRPVRRCTLIPRRRKRVDRGLRARAKRVAEAEGRDPAALVGEPHDRVAPVQPRDGHGLAVKGACMPPPGPCARGIPRPSPRFRRPLRRDCRTPRDAGDRAPASTNARSSGWVEPRASDAATARHSRGTRGRRAASLRALAAAPSVSVPVLSNTKSVAAASASIAWARVTTRLRRASAPGRHRHRDGRRERERARAGDDEHRDRDPQRARRIDGEPGEPREERHPENRRDEEARGALRRLDPAGTLLGGALHQGANGAEHARRSDVGHAHDERARRC